MYPIASTCISSMSVSDSFFYLSAYKIACTKSLARVDVFDAILQCITKIASFSCKHDYGKLQEGKVWIV